MSTRLAAASLLALAVAGCGSSSHQSQTTATATQPKTSATTTAASSSTGINALGKSVTVPIGGTKLQVTVKKLVDPVSAPKQTGPYAGDRVVAVMMSLKNVGAHGYAGAPSDYASLATTGGEHAPLTPTQIMRCAKLGGASIRLAAGDSVASCIAYDVGPQQPVNFTLRPGPGSTAEWNLH